MKNKLKQALKKNEKVDAFARILCYPMFSFQYRRECAQARARIMGKADSRYQWIKQWKGKYTGQRCFVVATGPSLTIGDLEAIQDEYCFGMNSCILSFHETQWRPDFYGIQDVYVYEKLKDQLEQIPENDLREVWVGDPIQKRYKIPERFKPYALNLLDHKMYHRAGYGKFQFTDDCYACVYDSYSVTFSLMQFACYMGFREIYLIGCDCNYNQPKKHFREYGHLDPKARIMGDKMIAGHAAFKEFADKKGVKVVNCTRGGMLEVYPRMSLESVLSKECNV